jgi:hypothetical protein
VAAVEQDRIDIHRSLAEIVTTMQFVRDDIQEIKDGMPDFSTRLVALERAADIRKAREGLLFWIAGSVGGIVVWCINVLVH